MSRHCLSSQPQSLDEVTGAEVTVTSPMSQREESCNWALVGLSGAS